MRGQALPVWHPTRLNSCYHHALHLAGVVLDGASPEHQAGGLRIDGYLFNMNKLLCHAARLRRGPCCRVLLARYWDPQAGQRRTDR
ncbi:5-methylcytosine restriction system specificity protein McrC [Streptomyces sp. NPDC002206]